MKLSHKDGIKVTHPVTGYELWLTGSIDYTVIYYDRKQGDHHCESYYYSFNYFFGSTFSDQLVKSGGAKRLSFWAARGCLFLIEAKHTYGDEPLDESGAKAISQAVALLKSVTYEPCSLLFVIWISFSILRCSNERTLAFQKFASVWPMGCVGSSMYWRGKQSTDMLWVKTPGTELGPWQCFEGRWDEIYKLYSSHPWLGKLFYYSADLFHKRVSFF